MAPIVNMLPTVEPAPGEKLPKLERIGSLATRLVAMADGGSLAILEKAGLRDADPKHKPTKSVFPLDHIMVTEQVGVARFEVDDMDGISDHRMIFAELTLS
jgi:endonuclease/exonuclease/phosphatase family metal-dependent hydrolase